VSRRYHCADAVDLPVTIERAAWGVVNGRPIDLFTLTNARGLVAAVTSYGATLVRLLVPDRDGVLGDIVLGYDTVDEYVASPPWYFGATVGRVGNRIAGARFSLDDRTYELAANESPSHLHGGVRGWDKVVWAASPIEAPDGPSVEFRYRSIDGEEGYPGTVDAVTRYTLTDDGRLAIEMTATTDRPTIVNMVHHSYFDLGAGRGGDVLDHTLQLSADAFTPGMPPDGRAQPVAGTPFDFLASKPIGRDLAAAGSPGGGAPPGYDGNWIVDGPRDALRPVGRLHDPGSGRLMTLRANQPGVQFYSGVFLDGTTSGKGRRHDRYSGLCLETQAFPNAVNVPAWRDQVVLRPGQQYRHVMLLGFGVE
jgi:aldose 1-epimerase